MTIRGISQAACSANLETRTIVFLRGGAIKVAIRGIGRQALISLFDADPTVTILALCTPTRNPPGTLLSICGGCPDTVRGVWIALLTITHTVDRGQFPFRHARRRLDGGCATDAKDERQTTNAHLSFDNHNGLHLK